jgi:hypothetical protein
MSSNEPRHVNGAAAADRDGIAWWNALSAAERAAKLEYASRVLGRPASAGDAWALHNDRLPPDRLSGDGAVCRRCGHTYAEHDRSDKYTVEACAVDGCKCSPFTPAK